MAEMLRFFEWKEFHSIFHVLGFARLSDDVKIADALPDGYLKGVGINDATERLSGLLTLGGFGQEIIVEGEQNPAESACAVKKLGIGITFFAVFLGGQNIDTAHSEAERHRLRNVFIHIKRDRHYRRLFAFNLSSKGEGPVV